MIDQNIKNIIFDFGGVILNINPLLTYQAFTELGLTNLFEGAEFAKPDESLLLFEKGLISPQEFRNKIRQGIQFPVQDQEIDAAWNAMLLDIPNERIALLQTLKNKYNIYLLSNTNEIHYIAYTAELKRVHGINTLAELFEEAYFSFTIHMNKPHKDIYEYVINKSALVPEETLFIDDSILNIEGAKSAGLMTHHLTGTQSINDLFGEN
jgi:FMN phosphatase YigB (HAD superfamily)